VLLGRGAECAVLDGVLEAVRTGESRTLILHGEPGVGKSALLEYVAERATGCRVARVASVQSEMELAFAGLHQLCATMLGLLDRLPAPQRDALRTAFGLSAGEAADRFHIGLAVLSLLSEVAAEQPLVCLIDDAQWLDRASAQTLAFVARRLEAESVALVFARRVVEEDGMAGLPKLAIGGLDESDARALLASALRWPLDVRVRDRLVAETRGNPLALLELSYDMSPTALAGGFGLPGARALSGRIEDSFQQRLASLPADTQQLLVVAAAEPAGDPVLVLRAAERLGIGVTAAAAAANAGLCKFGTLVRFRHPLVRSAAYRAASSEDRRSAHRALAEVTDPEADPDRRAWHRASAARGPDEEVAAELEQSAGRAQARGGIAAAAAFLERSAALTTDPARQARRALAAAQAEQRAGAPEAALELLAAVEAGPLDDLQRARVPLLRAQIAFAVNRGKDAPPLLLAAARRLERLNPALARQTYLDALSAATFVGHLGEGAGVQAVARAVRAAPPAPTPLGATDLLLDGLTALLLEGAAAGAPLLQRALAAFRGGQVTEEEELRWGWLASQAALDLWDDDAWHALASRHVELARRTGALAVLPIALNTRIGSYLSNGELDAAASLAEEVRSVTEATGGQLTPYIGLSLAAFRGREAEAGPLIEATMSDAPRRGEGIAVTIAHWASAVLYNGLGRYDAALEAAQKGSEHPEELRYHHRSLVELIEAAARSGRPDLGRAALERLTESTQAGGTDLALGTEARSRALLCEGAAAERLYREAIERLARTRVTTALARAQLLYGEWLRSERRRLQAREQLRTAHAQFTTMGTEAFADRAAHSLLATGETARRRTRERADRLTSQEAQIARLAGTGLSNPEIGARLFISPRTVQYHLHKVFAKLDISSRTQLESALASRPS
jgi:DNA-binding CsgD family transcriptional regulator